MKIPRPRFHRLTLHAGIAAVTLHLPTADGGVLYWDANGATPESGNLGGTWNTGTNWTLAPDGNDTTQAWADGESAVFSAGSDGVGTFTVNVSGTVATPSILLDEVGLVSLAGGSIDITGGSVFDTSVLGITGGRQLIWSSSIIGNGPLTLATHGSTSNSGDGTNSFFVLSGTNTFTGDVTITSGILRANSNLGPVTNKVILDGGGIVDPNLNLNFPYPIQVNEGKVGIYRTWGSVATGQASGAILGAGTLRHTDGGTLSLTGDGSAFTGTLDNVRGTLTLTTNDWSGSHILNADGAAVRFTGAGTTTIRSYEGDRDVFIAANGRLNVSTGQMKVTTGDVINAFIVQPASGTAALTSSSGTLNLDWDVSYNVQPTHSISVRVEDFDPGTPLTLVKNGPGALSGFNQANTYTGGTIINDGRINAQNASALGTGLVTVKSDDELGTASQVWLNSAGINIPNSFKIAGIGPGESVGNLGAIRFDNNTTVSGNVEVTADARVAAWNGAVGTITGALTGTRDLEINFFSNPTANGTINLTGNLTGYSGELKVSRGRLNIPTGTVGGSLMVDDAGIISGKPTFTGDLTLGFLGGATIQYDPTTSGSLHANGNVTLSGQTIISPTSLVPGTFTVLTYGGTLDGDASNFTVPGGLGSLRPGSGFDLSETGKVKFTLNSGNLTWTGAESNDWSLGPINWAQGVTPTGFYDFDSVTFTDTVRASITTDLPGINDDLVFTAKTPGVAGEDISIEYIDTAVINTPLSVAVSGTSISVTLGIDSSNFIISTAADIKAAIEASPAASALVAVSLATDNSGTGVPVDMAPIHLIHRGRVSIPTGVVAKPAAATFDHSSIGYLLSGPGTVTNTPITKKGTATLTLGHPTDYNQAAAIVTGSSSVLIEKGILAFSSRAALSANTPVTLGHLNSGNDDTVLEVPRAAAGDQVVLTPAITLGTLASGSTSRAVVRYTGLSNGSTITNGAASVNGTTNLNGRDLYLENTSHLTGGTTRLWNFQSAISGTGNVRVVGGSNPNGSTNGGPRIRIQSTANNWTGDLYLERGELQIGFTAQVIPDNSLAIFSPGTRMTMGNTAETMRGMVGGGATEAIPFNSDFASNTGNTSTVRVTLTDTNAANTHVYNGAISNGSPGFMAVTKAGAATQVFNGPCSYTGTTLVTAGRLVVNQAFTSAVTVSGGATLGGVMTSTTSVTATASGARVAPGYPIGTMTAASANLSTGGILDIEVNSAAPAINDRIVTTGNLNITGTTLNVTVTGTAPSVIVLATYGSLTGTFGTTTGIPSGYNLVYNYNNGVTSNNIALVGTVDPYASWLATYPAITGANRSPEADFDGDGIANGLEFIFGTNPTSPTASGLPVATVSGGNLIYTFKRSAASRAYTVTVEHGTSLQTWPGQIVVPTVTTAGPPVTVVNNGAAPDDITVTIPLNADPRRFVRVNSTIPFTP